MKCVCVEAAKRVVVKNIDVPRPKEDEVLIQVAASGICGTDLHIWEGDYVAQYPLVIGHEFSGKVVECGSACTRIDKGDRVAVEPNIPCNNCEHCLSDLHHYCTNMRVPGVTMPGGMAEYVCVPEIGVFSIEDVPYTAAAFMEPLSCVLHAADRLDAQVGSRILVMGAGPNGILQGKVSSLKGVSEIDYLDKNQFRAHDVSKYGWGQVFHDIGDVPLQHYNAVIEATGVSALASQAYKFVIPTGKVLVFGVPKMGTKIEVDAFSMFKNEISYIGTYTSKKDSIRAVEVLKHGNLNLEALISHSISLDEVPAYLQKLKLLDEHIKKVMVVHDIS